MFLPSPKKRASARRSRASCLGSTSILEAYFMGGAFNPNCSALHTERENYKRESSNTLSSRNLQHFFLFRCGIKNTVYATVFFVFKILYKIIYIVSIFTICSSRRISAKSFDRSLLNNIISNTLLPPCLAKVQASPTFLCTEIF